MRPYIGSPNIGNIPQHFDALSRSINAVALHNLDNGGYKYLKERRPDTVVQLEKLSQGWMIIPKASLASRDCVQDAINNMREWVSVGMFPEDKVPIGTSKREYLDKCAALADYLEGTIKPALADYVSPHELKEVIENGVEFEDESKDGGVNSRDDGEEPNSERLDNSQA